MSEAPFDACCRQYLHERYYPFGVWWNNKTGYGQSYHPPWPCAGAGDLIGCLLGLWIEVENKALRGSQRKNQKIREKLVTSCGALYVVCHETGIIGERGYDIAFARMSMLIELHVAKLLGKSAVERMTIK